MMSKPFRKLESHETIEKGDFVIYRTSHHELFRSIGLKVENFLGSGYPDKTVYRYVDPPRPGYKQLNKWDILEAGDCVFVNNKTWPVTNYVGKTVEHFNLFVVNKDVYRPLKKNNIKEKNFDYDVEVFIPKTISWDKAWDLNRNLYLQADSCKMYYENHASSYSEELKKEVLNEKTYVWRFKFKNYKKDIKRTQSTLPAATSKPVEESLEDLNKELKEAMRADTLTHGKTYDLYHQQFPEKKEPEKPVIIEKPKEIINKKYLAYE